MRLLAFFAVILFFLLMWVYVREFAVLYNTIGVGKLAGGSMMVVAGLLILAYLRRGDRFKPWQKHVPEIALIGIMGILFAPLLGSLFNRAYGDDKLQSFEFVAETAYFASGYGVLKGEKLQPSGWRLTIRDGGQIRTFKYKKQAYFPLTQPGENILLPVRKGLLGFRVVILQ
ncbi:MAG: hypothetical protein SFV22_13555 [Saprospiraceae bacterium]|nr:hypothetical protein [Saprospiraceae bacterium]